MVVLPLSELVGLLMGMFHLPLLVLVNVTLCQKKKKNNDSHVSLVMNCQHVQVVPCLCPLSARIGSAPIQGLRDSMDELFYEIMNCRLLYLQTTPTHCMRFCPHSRLQRGEILSKILLSHPIMTTCFDFLPLERSSQLLPNILSLSKILHKKQ